MFTGGNKTVEHHARPDLAYEHSFDCVYQ